MLIHSMSLEELLHLQIVEPNDWVDWIQGSASKPNLTYGHLSEWKRLWVGKIDGRQDRGGIALCEPSSC